MTTDGDEPRRAKGRQAAGFSDALTYAFADPAADVCGVARLGLSEAGASGLVTLFRAGEELAVVADGDGAPADRWEAVRAAGVSTETLDGGARWALHLEGETALELEFEAVAPGFPVAADSAVGRAGGMEGAEQICRVSGVVAGERFAGHGQRSRAWGVPDWERMTLVRTVTAWFDDDRAISLLAVRSAKASEHGQEAVEAVAVEDEGAVVGVADARLSTTYDAEGRQRAAGLELYVGEEDEFPRRIAGEAAAGTSLDLGRLRLHCAFFRWRSAGRQAVGRYDVLRRLA